MALNLNFGETDGPTVSDDADQTRPPSIVGREPTGTGSLESPFRIRTKQNQKRMQTILGAAVLGDRAPTADAKDTKYVH